MFKSAACRGQPELPGSLVFVWTGERARLGMEERERAEQKERMGGKGRCGMGEVEIPSGC